MDARESSQTENTIYLLHCSPSWLVQPSHTANSTLEFLMNDQLNVNVVYIGLIIRSLNYLNVSVLSIASLDDRGCIVISITVCVLLLRERDTILSCC